MECWMSISCRASFSSILPEIEVTLSLPVSKQLDNKEVHFWQKTKLVWTSSIDHTSNRPLELERWRENGRHATCKLTCDNKWSYPFPIGCCVSDVHTLISPFDPTHYTNQYKFLGCVQQSFNHPGSIRCVRCWVELVRESVERVRLTESNWSEPWGVILIFSAANAEVLAAILILRLLTWSSSSPIRNKKKTTQKTSWRERPSLSRREFRLRSISFSFHSFFFILRLFWFLGFDLNFHFLFAKRKCWKKQLKVARQKKNNSL